MKYISTKNILGKKLAAQILYWTQLVQTIEDIAKIIGGKHQTDAKVLHF